MLNLSDVYDVLDGTSRNFSFLSNMSQANYITVTDHQNYFNIYHPVSVRYRPTESLIGNQLVT